MVLIKIDKDKNIVPNKEITYYLNPDYIYVPVKRISVKQNDYVSKKEIVGKGQEITQVSGHVYGTKMCQVLNKTVKTLVIANDFREFNKYAFSRKKTLNIENLLKLVEKDAKLYDIFKSSKSFSNIVICALNDNPYVYNKIYLLRENIQEVLAFITKLSLLFNSTNNLLVVKNNEAWIIDECLNVLGSYPNIKLSLVNDLYLLEEKRFLLEKLKIGKNTLYLDIDDLMQLINLFKNNLDTTKLITISGDAIEESKVLRVKINTSLMDVINKFIDIKENKYDIYVNGILKGFKINAKDFIVTQEVEAINIMKKRPKKISKCIKCGRCMQICPVGANPLTKINKEKCISCGLCNYICPCNIELKEKMEKR